MADDIRESLGEWLPLLSHVFEHPKIMQLGVMLAYEQSSITPSLDDVFKAFELCPPSKLKVLIIGQDPYPTPGMAHGLSFSTANGKVPASLRIIFKELAHSGWKRTNPNLTDWAEQGVLLLNTVLTTQKGKIYAHRGIGWEVFVAKVFEQINQLPQRIAVMAWGASAQELAIQYIAPASTRLMLYACHPMAQQYSGGAKMFVGCDHFNRANQFISEPINWGEKI